MVWNASLLLYKYVKHDHVYIGDRDYHIFDVNISRRKRGPVRGPVSPFHLHRKMQLDFFDISTNSSNAEWRSIIAVEPYFRKKLSLVSCYLLSSLLYYVNFEV